MGITACLLSIVFISSCGKKDQNVCTTCTARTAVTVGNAGTITTSNMEECGSSGDVANAEANFRNQNPGATVECTRK
ncbi:hypothetical protein [Pedobacter frigidisoli]|nr:hypothetical protein [Pedobacter frigidisoli]